MITSSFSLPISASSGVCSGGVGVLLAIGGGAGGRKEGGIGEKEREEGGERKCDE